MQTARQKSKDSVIKVVDTTNKVTDSRERRNEWKSVTGKPMVYRTLKTQPINFSQLRDANYQREINKANVAKIVEEFNIGLLNPPKVYLDAQGLYHVIDGQHTIMAMVQKFGEDIDITCVVIDVNTVEGSAAIFAHQQDYTKPLTVNEKFKAKVIAKESRELDILDICRQWGLELDYSKSATARPGIIVCTKTLIDIFNKGGGELLSSTLEIITRAYNDNVESYTNKFIKAISEFIFKFQDDPNYKTGKFMEALGKHVSSPIGLCKQAEEDRKCSHLKYGSTKGYDYCIMALLLEAYNKGKQQKFRLTFN